MTRRLATLLEFPRRVGLADNTIVMYSTDNGPHMNSWPDAGMTPFRSEKNSNWEGAYRVPCMVRWPGTIQAGQVLNGIISPQRLVRRRSWPQQVIPTSLKS